MGESPVASLLLGVMTAGLHGLPGSSGLPSPPRAAADLRGAGPAPGGRRRSASLVLVSIFSGVGEEAFFRGAVQQEFGLVVASLLFGLAHIGPDRRLPRYGRCGRSWPASCSAPLRAQRRACSPPSSPTPGTTPRRSCSGNAPAGASRRPAPLNVPRHHHGQEWGAPPATPCWPPCVRPGARPRRSIWPGDFSPGEELISPGAEDIAVSREDTTYPTSDTLRFEGRPEVVYVYSGSRIRSEGDLEARVGRTARDSVLGRLLGGEGSGRRKEARSRSASGGGVSGVLKFAVRPGREASA